ncbi:right-handed parallel beta-helix repeat-containing protein [Solibacillus sp. FSL H8-0523]|uniref:right-handed parallel beta-helix repeat-containing protein n=1 Tax=Solibacillus sp. FSL H8-0523 TaxID=2954511 RepID=UPI0031012AFA
MAIIKVSTSVFSLIKTVERAIQKASQGDTILVAAGKYKEALTIEEDVSISAKIAEHALIEGIIIVPKGKRLLLENITLHPTSQIFVEGTLHLINCVVKGALSNVLLSLNEGNVVAEKCQFTGATDVAVVLLNKSRASFEDCYFESNEKSHLLIEDSTIELVNSELLKSNHAVWLKSNSDAVLEQVRIHHHTGTQIIVQDASTLHMQGCGLEHGEGNGIYASKQSKIHINGTVIQHHALPQLWIQNSQLHVTNSQVNYGNESGLMLRECAEATITNTSFSHHKIANVQLTLESLLNMTTCQIYSCQGVGVQLKDKSIANFNETVFADNVLPQLFLSEHSICSLKDTTIKDGKQVGIFVEKNASCSIVSSAITNQENTAITVIGAELFMLDSIIQHNKGNGVLTVNQANTTIEGCTFQQNDMPHIAGKDHANVSIANCELIGGKGIFMVDNCQLDLRESTIRNGTGVQVEVVGQTKASVFKTYISDGDSNGIKVMKDATMHITESHITAHKMPQIVVNDSSVIFKNSELLCGGRNGLIIENNAEAFIQDSFISNHLYPQIWIDLNSAVELSDTQLTEGHESDIYVQNNSTLHANNCIIQNDKFIFNVQAVNNSKINLTQTTVENSIGDKFYSENNSQITYTLDELN